MSGRLDGLGVGRRGIGGGRRVRKGRGGVVG